MQHILARCLVLVVTCLAAINIYAQSGTPNVSRILVYGDSLSAAYGMAESEGWVALLKNRLAPQGVEVINHSVSGETTSGGINRFSGVLERSQPDLVILQLGANDGLRGLSVKTMKSNLAGMIEQSHAINASVLLVAVQIPPNYGKRYTSAFDAVFTGLSEQSNTTMMQFMTEQVFDNPDMMQQDNLHPNTEAQPILMENVWVSLEPLLAGNGSD